MSIRKSNLDKMLAQDRPIILDGGLCSELDRRGYDISTPLWSAELLMNSPQAIKDIHRAYLDAGAQCITSASYQASIAGFGAMGLSPGQARELFIRSVDLAKSAVDEYLQQNPDCGYQPLVAASIGPYGAFLADGSEYNGDYGVDDQTLLEFHRQRLIWLDAAAADVLACETIPSLQEAGVLRQLLERVNTPAWLCFSCQDERLLNDGNRLGQAVALFDHSDRIVGALGVRAVRQAIEVVVQSIVADLGPDGTRRVQHARLVGTVDPAVGVDCGGLAVHPGRCAVSARDL